MAISKARQQLANDIMRLIQTTAPDQLESRLIKLFADRGVQCIEERTWSQEDMEAVPTGYPVAPTGATPADRALDRAGVDDLSTEISYLRQRLDQLTARLPHSSGKPVVPVTKAEHDEKLAAMRRIGMDPNDYEPY